MSTKAAELFIHTMNGQQIEDELLLEDSCWVDIILGIAL